MSVLWFITFSIAWTGLLAGGAHLLTQNSVPARHAHNIWRGAAVLSVVPWVLMFAHTLLPTLFATPIPDMPYIGDAVEALSNTGAVKAAAHTTETPLLGLLLLALLVAGWVFRAGCNLLSQMRLQAIKRKSVPSDTLSAETWARRLNIAKAPGVAIIPTGSPFLAGIRQRTIYLPEAVCDPMNANIICAHECTHMARGDLLTRPMERLIADLFWFSPFAWAIRRQLDYWREAACDERTASLTGDSVAYARALANTARLTRPMPRTELPVAAFILPRSATLKKRLTQLLASDAKKPRRSLAIAALIAGLALAPLSLAQAVTLSSSDIFSHAVIIHPKAKVSFAYGKHVKNGKESWHRGIDIKAPEYTYIYAPAKAKVLQAEFKLEFGNTVDILLEDGRKMRFSQMAHMNVKKGDWIKPGDIIGKVGATGRTASGPHLHFEVYQDGEHVDPASVRGLVLIAS
ncbi:MAG: peptidoglycan DD-metalloendopeptidase family protein [Alphaproteobacteria bacterium]|nr:peptidoglycan DD-metalloendopeptidase family protein [Alphaproteobacteria bacterium]